MFEPNTSLHNFTFVNFSSYELGQIVTRYDFLEAVWAMFELTPLYLISLLVNVLYEFGKYSDMTF